ncbi:AraC-type DNA-binding protein [Paenibacillaceae bacterium GAS479]|nr:AraC-type DNA-binding protein [Paenibacillaceae bacterium GAS479]
MDKHSSPLTLNNRGVLAHRAGAMHYRIERLLPSGPAAAFIRHYWLIEWELPPGQAHVQEVLEHPSVNVVLEPGCSVVSIVSPGRSSQKLEGKGQVMGMLFRPGAFRAWLDRDPGELAGKRLPAAELLGPELLELEQAVFAESEPTQRAKLADAFWADRVPEPDASAQLVDRIVIGIQLDRSQRDVEGVAERWGLSVRSLQRLFRTYLGVSPKWVIQRYRMHETVELAVQGGEREPNWAALAVELGYFDQAHLIRDFKATIGKTPASYRRQAAAAESNQK